MSRFFEFVLLVFACYRLSCLLVYDTGPFGIIDDLRLYLGRSTHKKGWVGRVFKELAELISCVHCIGIWIAFFLAFVPHTYNLVDFFIYWFAIAGFQSLISFRSDE